MTTSQCAMRARSVNDELTTDVLAGLRQTPKTLSPTWFYDELGSSLFDSICELPEYYVTRTELQIMQDYADEMAQAIGPRAALIEFGSGTSLKTRLLLDKLQDVSSYVPIDISREHLLDAAGNLARDYPALRITPVCADFTQAFDLPVQIAAARRRVVYFPGSTLGNFEHAQAQHVLANMRTIAGRNGAVLIGIDLKKDPGILQRAYDDAAGVTARFNLNALRHLNRKLGSDFNLDAFEHCALWVENKSRIEMHLVSTRDQTVHLGNDAIRIARGEHLRTECCHKYTLEGFARLAAEADLQVDRIWTDEDDQFSVQLLTPRASD